ncbi:MAG: hypothetical protein ACE5DL_00295 [Nitrosopumilaceae archaeon]
MKNKVIPLVIFLFLIPLPAFADDDAEDVIQSLGWVAIGCGIIANLPFILLNKYRRYAVSAGGQSLQMARKIGTVFKPVLNFHIMMNSIGYFAGMTHGLLLSEHLDSISMSLAITMTVLMGSGILLKYSSSRHTKLFNRLLHGQFGLVLLLIALIALHMLTTDD